MKLIVLRDENSKFFKSYWKKWYELGRSRRMSETNRTPSQKDALEVLLGGQIIKIQKSQKCSREMRGNNNDNMVRLHGES